MSLESDILQLEADIRTASDRLRQLRSAKTERDSKAFIAANQITKEQVEFPDGDGKPWFGDVWVFAKWLRSNSSKRWAVWNGRIFHTTDLLNERFSETPGLIEHL